MKFIESIYGRPNTVRTYESLYARHIEPLVSIEKCAGWTELDTLAVIRQWENKLSCNTIATLLRLLSRFIEFNGGSKLDTTKFIKSLSRSSQQKETLVLSRPQAEALMTECRSKASKFYPILLLGLHAGLRRGEVYGLEQGDIDYNRQRIKISRSYDGPTKSGKTRYVPMSVELGRLLADLGDGKLFKLGDPNPKLKKLCKSIGVPEAHFHTLRHTFATLALESSASPRKVQEWLGHASLTTTLDIYWGVINNGEDSLDFLPGGQ